MRRGALAFVLLALSACTVMAQPAPSASEPTPAATRVAPSATLTVQPSKFSILEDYVLEARVVNETAKPIQIRSAEICFGPDFVRGRGIGKGSTCVPVNCNNASQSESGPDDPKAVARDCEFDSQTPSGQARILVHYDRAEANARFDWGRLAALLGWTQRQVPVSLKIEYSGAESAKFLVTKEIKLEVVASLTLLFAGVVLGAGLLSGWVYARGKETLAQVFRLFATGSITGIITILLIQRVGDLDLPFKFAVNDVVGGIIVGLFSIKLGKTLSGYFLDSTAASAMPGPPSASGRVAPPVALPGTELVQNLAPNNTGPLGRN